MYFVLYIETAANDSCKGYRLLLIVSLMFNVMADGQCFDFLCMQVILALSKQLPLSMHNVSTLTLNVHFSFTYTMVHTCIYLHMQSL